MLDLMKVKPHETLMVGDWAERDVVGAAKVGMRTVFARYGDRFDTIDAHADYDIMDIKDLLDIIQKENRIAPSV